MFNTIGGIPAHPLLIHAAVIFIPLLILGAVVYALWPRARVRIGWAVVALAPLAPEVPVAGSLAGSIAAGVPPDGSDAMPVGAFEVPSSASEWPLSGTHFTTRATASTSASPPATTPTTRASGRRRLLPCARATTPYRSHGGCVFRAIWTIRTL